MSHSKTACFRFYAELNDFLPLLYRQKRFVYRFELNPAIKDAIESLGVPHTEIDLIIVNENSVDFAYSLQNGDQVAVYPQILTMDLQNVTHLHPKPLRKIQFILDVHLGKLARYLRLFGFNVLYDNHLDDPEIMKIAAKEQRIILTRDKGILMHKKVQYGYWVRATKPELQLVEIIRRFDLQQLINPFSRCLQCNGEIRLVAKKEIQEKLPLKTKQFFDEFTQCQHCQRIYWAGSHYDRMQHFINNFMKQYFS